VFIQWPFRSNAFGIQSTENLIKIGGLTDFRVGKLASKSGKAPVIIVLPTKSYSYT